MIQLKNISLSAANGSSRMEILKNISIDFKKGKFYCITGPNGGGKTTLAKVIMGITKPDSGKIYFEGKDITDTDITERARMGIGYAFQQPPRFKGIRVIDILRIAANGDKGIRKSLKSVGLCPEDYMEREVDASLSGGEIKRIEIATILLKQPKAIIYDEPEAGVDLWSFDALVDVIRQNHINNQALTIVITHQERILSLADEIIVISDGEVQARGTAEDIMPQLKSGICCKFRELCGGGDYAECIR